MKHSITAALVVATVGFHTATLAVTLEAVPSVSTDINVSADSKPGWAPTPEQREQVLNTVRAYIEAVDEARYDEAFAMHEAGYRDLLPLPQFVQIEQALHAKAGTAEFLRVLKITWYKNSARAPGPGVYVAIDVTALFERADRYCGYIILLQKPDGGDFEIVRREHNFLDNATAEAIVAQHSAEELDRIWAQVAQVCPNYVPIAEIQ